MTLDLPVRFSHLRAYGRSAAHGYLARAQESQQTTAMQRGTAVHALIFGTRKVMGWDGPQRRGKAYDEFASANPDVEILTATEYEKASRMAQAVRDSEVAAPFLKGDFEKTILFDWYGRKCRATPDVRGDGHVTELKTAASSDPNRFVWDALRRHYNAQLRMQQIACGDKGNEAYIVCVESAEPFPVTVFHVEPRALDFGYRNLCLWMERLKNCEAAGLYPPYVESVVPLDAPDDLELDYGDNDDGDGEDTMQAHYGIQP